MNILFASLLCLQIIKPFGPPMPQTTQSLDKPHFLNWFLINAELLDPREVRYVFSKKDEYVSDWKMIYRRMDDLKDAPYTWESYRFSPREIVNDLLLFNRAYKRHLDGVFELYPYNKTLQLARKDTEYLYKVWDCARDCKCEYYYVHIRRQALKRLKIELDKFDKTWFDRGVLPAHIPYWAFTEVR